jgi:WD40 repeat protein
MRATIQAKETVTRVSRADTAALSASRIYGLTTPWIMAAYHGGDLLSPVRVATVAIFVCLCALDANSETVQLDHGAPVDHLVFSRDGRKLVAASSEGKVTEWDAASLMELATYRAPGVLWDVAFREGSELVGAVVARGTLQVWTPTTGRLLTVPGVVSGSDDRYRCARLSPDGRVIGSTTERGVIFLSDSRTGTGLKSHVSQGPRPWDMALANGGSTIAIARQDGSLFVWQPPSPFPPAPAFHIAGTPFHAVFSPDARTLAVPGHQAVMAYVWSTERQRAVFQTQSGHRRMCIGAAFSPERRVLATFGAEPSVILWECASGNKVTEIDLGKEVVRAIAFSPDSKVAAIAQSNLVHLERLDVRATTDALARAVPSQRGASRWWYGIILLNVLLAATWLVCSRHR